MILDRARFDNLDHLMSVGYGHVPSLVIEALIEECGELPIPIPDEFRCEHWMSPDTADAGLYSDVWAQRWARRFKAWRKRARAEARRGYSNRGAARFEAGV